MRNEIVKRNVTKMSIYAGPGVLVHEGRQISSLHRHEELEFLPIYSGLFHCYSESGARYDATAGDVIFVNSGVPHATACEDET